MDDREHEIDNAVLKRLDLLHRELIRLIDTSERNILESCELIERLGKISIDKHLIRITRPEARRLPEDGDGQGTTPV